MDEQSRKWILTINNPDAYNITREYLIDVLQGIFIDYTCFAYEKATTGTIHMHVYIYRSGAIRFSTLKKKLPTAHIEKAFGTSIDNRNYIKKEGKWANSQKHETSIDGTFEEFGDMPTERSEKAPMMVKVMEDIKSGISMEELFNLYPNLLFKGKEIEYVQNQFRLEKYSREIRKINVSYLYGSTGTGKTKSIFEKYLSQDICRITTYSRDKVLFDAYHGQPVLVFEEFKGQIPINDMLNYLDIYPLNLPARYNDRIACYTDVYLTSNLPLENMYADAQRGYPNIWNAFIRRIRDVVEFVGTDITINHNKEDYYVSVQYENENPFI